MIRLLVCVLVLLVVAGCRVTPDNEIELHLKDSRVVNGEVVSNDGKNIEIQTDNGLAKVHISEIGFTDGEEFSDGLAAVKTGDKWGMIDTLGNLIILPRYDEIRKYFNNRIPVRMGRKWGFLDGDGSLAIDLLYSDALAFSEGLAAVQKNLNYGYIDTTGNIQIVFMYFKADRFYDGLAMALHMNKLVYINRYNKHVIEDGIQAGYSSIDSLVAVKKDGKYGYCDSKGELVVGYKFDKAMPFNEGLAPVYIRDVNGDTLCGYIDNIGNWLINPQYQYCSPFTSGIAKVIENGEENFITQEGQKINLPDYKIYQFFNGLAEFYKDGYYGYINKEGDIVVECIYEYTDNYRDGFGMVTSGGYINYLDLSFERILQ